MRYSEEFKDTVIEDFKVCPFYKTISAKYKIERGTIKSWVRKYDLDVAKLVDEYESIKADDVLLSNFTKILIS